MRRNDFVFMADLYGDGELVRSHFRGHEFENDDGWVMVHPSVLVSLELVRKALSKFCAEEVEVIPTDSTRSQADLERLAAKYKWIDQGGTVSRNSKHLEKYEGIAVDLKARIKRTKRRVPQKTVGEVCRVYFDWVKDDYDDGHVHADNRNQLE